MHSAWASSILSHTSAMRRHESSDLLCILVSQDREEKGERKKIMTTTQHHQTIGILLMVSLTMTGSRAALNDRRMAPSRLSTTGAGQVILVVLSVATAVAAVAVWNGAGSCTHDFWLLATNFIFQIKKKRSEVPVQSISFPLSFLFFFLFFCPLFLFLFLFLAFFAGLVAKDWGFVVSSCCC